MRGNFKSLNNSLGGLSFGIDGDGNYGYYRADGSLIPFKGGAEHFYYYYMATFSIATPNETKEFTVTNDGTLHYNLLYESSRSVISYLSLYINDVRIQYYSNNNLKKYDQTYDVKAGDIVKVMLNGSDGFLGIAIFDAYVE